MAPSPSPSRTAGIDVSKAYLDLALYPYSGSVERFENSNDGVMRWSHSCSPSGYYG